VEFDGAKIPHLFPGEKLSLNRPEQPTANFAAFEDAFNRHFAAGLGISFEQYAKDYSQTNYSGARAGLADAWRTFEGKRSLIQSQHATQEYALWLEEDMDRHPEEIPPGSPDFAEAKTAWCGCAWIGPGRGTIDPLKDAKGTALELEYGATTLEQWCAEQGRDWEAVMEQRALELRRQAELEKLHNIRFESDARTAAMGAPTDSGEAA
jgi:lambda family phage portal protein